MDAVNHDRHPREEVLHEDSKEEDINEDDGDKSRGDLQWKKVKAKGRGKGRNKTINSDVDDDTDSDIKNVIFETADCTEHGEHINEHGYANAARQEAMNIVS